jgi:hypothetical protein
VIEISLLSFAVIVVAWIFAPESSRAVRAPESTRLPKPTPA